MKNTKQIAETVFKRRDEERRKLILRNKRIKTLAIGATTACIVCVGAFTAHSLGSESKKYTSPDEDMLISESVPTQSDVYTTNNASGSTRQSVTTPDDKPTTAIASTSALAETSTNKTTTKADKITAASTSQRTDASTAGSASTTKKIFVTTTAAETVIEPKWDEKTIAVQFMEFELNGKRYVTKNTRLTNETGEKLGAVTMTGYDIYEDKTHTINADIYSISGISSECAAAVKFEGTNGYYAYINGDFHPQTLGELADALDLNGNMSFGELYLSDERTHTSSYDRTIIMDALSEFGTAVNSENGNYFKHKKIFSISTNLDVLGISNKSFAFTEDGYITTNILEWGYSFYIGEDKADEIAEKFGIYDIEPTSSFSEYLPQEQIDIVEE